MDFASDRATARVNPWWHRPPLWQPAGSGAACKTAAREHAAPAPAWPPAPPDAPAASRRTGVLPQGPSESSLEEAVHVEVFSEHKWNWALKTCLLEIIALRAPKKHKRRSV